MHIHYSHSVNKIMVSVPVCRFCHLLLRHQLGHFFHLIDHNLVADQPFCLRRSHHCLSSWPHLPLPAAQTRKYPSLHIERLEENQYFLKPTAPTLPLQPVLGLQHERSSRRNLQQQQICHVLIPNLPTMHDYSLNIFSKNVLFWPLSTQFTLQIDVLSKPKASTASSAYGAINCQLYT